MTSETSARDNLAFRIQVLSFMLEEVDRHQWNADRLLIACAYIDKALACIEEAITD